MKYKEIFDKLGFSKLTEVQSKIENVNKNILILSSCGSGKTEASFFKIIYFFVLCFKLGSTTIIIRKYVFIFDYYCSLLLPHQT